MGRSEGLMVLCGRGVCITIVGMTDGTLESSDVSMTVLLLFEQSLVLRFRTESPLGCFPLEQSLGDD